MSRKNRPTTKDMYWFAHGGTETLTDKHLTHKGIGDVEEEADSNSLTWKNPSDYRGIHEDQKPSCPKDVSIIDGSNSSGPSSLERDDRLHAVDKRIAVEERKKQLLEAEQERNDAVLRKHMEREAALEARRNAQRSNISFAFGSSIPRNVESLQLNQNIECENMSRSLTAGGLSHKGEDLMTRSMTASISAPRGRRKNDLMPTVPYDRTATPRVATSSSSRKRSVSMTRLDQLAQPRRHYVEATKANSTASSGASSMLKDVCSPNRPLSSASEHSGGRVSSNVTRRVRSSPRKPRPVSIAGTIPDQKHITNTKSYENKAAPIKRNYTSIKKNIETCESKKAQVLNVKSTNPIKSSERVKSASRAAIVPTKTVTAKPSTSKQNVSKPKKQESKSMNSKSISYNSTPKTHISKDSLTNKKKKDILVSSPAITSEVNEKLYHEEKCCSPPPDSDAAVAENEKNSKRIISEEEAKTALAEKRKLAREQAEREAELERQRQEELRILEEDRLRQEEEEQKKMEEEHLRLLVEHRRQEEEKMRKAIEDQEQREEDERVKRDEELRLKAEQEKKAKEEAEKRLELEEKLRKEEEERAERKKRLEKIMSRTRGKSSGMSPSGSISGSDQLDSVDNQQEGFSSGANSLESNDAMDPSSEPVSSDDAMAKMDVSSGGNSIEANLTYEFSSNDVSLNSNDLMLPVSETASQDNSMVILSDRRVVNEKSVDNTDVSMSISGANELELSSRLQDVESNAENENSVVLGVKEMEPLENVVSELLIQGISENEEMEQHNIKFSNVTEDCIRDCDASRLTQLQETDFSVLEEKLSLSNSSVELPKDCEEMVSCNKSPISIQNQPQVDSESIQVEHCSLESLDQNAALHLGDNMFEYSKINVPEVVQNQYLEEKDEFLQNKHMEICDVNIPKDVPCDKLSGYLNAFNQDNVLAADISAQDIQLDEYAHQDHNTFEVNPNINQNPFSGATTKDLVVQDLLPNKSKVDSDLCEADIKTNLKEEQNFLEQKYEMGEDSNIVSKSTSFEEGEFLVKTKISDERVMVFPNESGDNENQIDKDNAISNVTSSVLGSEMYKDGNGLEQGDSVLHNDGLHSSFLTNNECEKSAAETFEFKVGNEISNIDGTSFISTSISGESELNMFQSQFSDYNTQEHTFLKSEQIDYSQNPIVNESLEISGNELNSVTLIKEEGNENLIGIISSIDHDHVSNNFSILREQFKNNFECASLTDSEDSSLDSNLSQIIAVENSEQNTNASLNHTETAVFETNAIHTSSNNVKHSDNPFTTEYTITPQDSIPKTAINHFTAAEMYSNGHSVESKTASGHNELHDYVQLDGNDILSVDHSRNNIFENVDAIDYSKVTPDSFLAKGSSKHISGNPFLMQDEQNKVFVTSDFLN